MRVFISWSGERSHRLAKAIGGWIPKVIQDVTPWLSSANINAGERWSLAVGQALENHQFGVLCLTPEQLSPPWVLFEAGALSKIVTEARVVPYLLGFEPRELSGPLGQFHAVKADKPGTLALLSSLNVVAGDRGVAPAILDESFELWWPKLAPVLAEIQATAPTEPPVPSRSPEDMMGEILSILRAQRASVPSGNADASPVALPYTPFGERLRELRGQCVLSQTELADKVGVSQVYISQLETGRRDPTAAIIPALAEALGVSREELLDQA